MTPEIKIGDRFTMTSAMGPYVSRVLRPHRDAGYFETVIESGGHPALLGSIQIEGWQSIAAAMKAGA